MLSFRVLASFLLTAFFIMLPVKQLWASTLEAASNLPVNPRIVSPLPDQPMLPPIHRSTVAPKATNHSKSNRINLAQDTHLAGEGHRTSNNGVGRSTTKKPTNETRATSVKRVTPSTSLTAQISRTPSRMSVVDYRIGPEDVLKIRVYERELLFNQGKELTEEFLVRSDGTVSLPFVGSIRVENRNEAEIESSIALKFDRLTNRLPIVNVEIAKRRPFFITGDVQNPGSYPFVPGMTVKHAIAISGGIFRLSRNYETLAIEAARENARSRDTIEKLKTAIATHARLAAELKKSKTITIPPRLLEIASREEATALINTEQQTLLANLKSLENLSVNYRREIKFDDKQIKALEMQRVHINKQVQLTSDRSARIDKLRSRGLTNETRVFEIQNIAARLLAQSLGVDSAIAQTNERRARAERELVRAMDLQESEISAKISQVQAEISSYEHAFRESRKILAHINGVSATSGDNRQTIMRHSIMRRMANGPKFFWADDTTTLEPGDVLEVIIDAEDVSAAIGSQ